ncbi:MAG: transcription antitermination factor NusB [Chloroflexota bacterium]|nr:transcription antitermination factor NusB [Chloroflexota bacterium]
MNEPDATNKPLPNGDTPETASPPAAADGRPRGKRRRRRSGDRSFLSRSQARELALQALFEIDVTDHDADEVLGRIATDDSLPPPVADYALTLARGVAAHQAEIDPRIAEAAPAFPLPQVANVDRNVLRLAIYELLHQPDVPLKAAINEAVELAKRFGGESSGRFVNGVLGTVAARLDGAGAAPADGQPTPG